MKYTSAFVIAALLGASFVDNSQAVKLSTTYSDDLMKSLAEDMQKEANGETEEAAPAAETPKPQNPKNMKINLIQLIMTIKIQDVFSFSFFSSYSFSKAAAFSAASLLAFSSLIFWASAGLSRLYILS